MRPCVQGMLLRRTKATRIDGQPVVDLPERRVVLRRIAFSPAERSYYDDLQKESASQLRVRREALDSDQHLVRGMPYVREDRLPLPVLTFKRPQGTCSLCLMLLPQQPACLLSPHV